MEKESLLAFKLPSGEEVEVYAIKGPDGRIILRSKEELDLLKKKE